MKILYICTVDFSLTGIPIHIRNFYNVLSKSNQIDIVSTNFSKDILDTMPLRNGTKLYDIPRGKNPLKYLVKLRKIVKNNNYDVIHIHGNSSTMLLELLACKKTNSLLIVHTHNVQYRSELLNKILLKPMFKNANLLFAASRLAGSKLYKNYKFHVINNGIKVSDFQFDKIKRLNIRKQLKLSKDCILLGNIGRFSEQKNQDFLIRIAKSLNLKKYHFLLIGDGGEDFSRRIEQQGLKKHFTILPASKDIAGYYSAFDIFLFPSKWEGLGMVAVEAQYADLPCIVSNTIPKEVQISKNLEFAPLDPDEWIKRIRKTLISRKSTIYTEKYEINNCADKLMKLYRIGIKQKYEHKKNT